MSEIDPTSALVLRAAYQISGFTRSRVSYDQIINVIPLSKEELRKIDLALQSCNLLASNDLLEMVELTAAGLACAAGLTPVSEPPLFQDI